MTMMKIACLNSCYCDLISVLGIVECTTVVLMMIELSKWWRRTETNRMEGRSEPEELHEQSQIGDCKLGPVRRGFVRDIWR